MVKQLFPCDNGLDVGTGENRLLTPDLLIILSRAHMKTDGVWLILSLFKD